MNVDPNALHAKFEPLWDDLKRDDAYPNVRPLLAHYTSIPTLECIIKNDELWLSNPLFMNDHEEMRFGINMAAREFRQHEGVRKACGGDARYEALCAAFEDKLFQVSNEHAFDTYIICFSEHHPEQDRDSRLSMWRGYGGNGSGAALVLNTAISPYVPGSPLILSKVLYASRKDRIAWINAKLDEFATLVATQDIPTSLFYVAVHSLLERFKIFALFTKHDGFREEQEWRLLYLKDRDKANLFSGMLSYVAGPNGIEPKLKLKASGVAAMIATDFSLRSIIHQIILGPSISSGLAISSVIRMLETLKMPNLCGKVVGSDTPYRAR